jgi:hypothetical protein
MPTARSLVLETMRVNQPARPLSEIIERTPNGRYNFADCIPGKWIWQECRSSNQIETLPCLRLIGQLS